MIGASGAVRLVRTRSELADELGQVRSRGNTLALIPTMGALHPGHGSLVERGATRADTTALSIFVNPLQFGPGEDLDRYPRPFEGDLAMAAAWGVGLVFAPSTDEMYPDGTPTVQVDPGPIAERLCGASRPGHFKGVLTVVARLFGLLRPDVAIFGRKDFQQAVLIRKMVRDLELGVEVEVAPLVREWDGLALSSRNRYLSPRSRDEALGLYRALSSADEAFRGGTRSARELESLASRVLAGFPGLEVEYVSVVDPERLEPLTEVEAGDVMAIAARCAGTRLIDNLVLGSTEPDPILPRTSEGASPLERTTPLEHTKTGEVR